MKSERWPILIFIALVVYLTFFYQIGNYAFTGADEPRYARISEEMVLRGEYATPTLNFIPWLEKPPLLFWIQAASYKAFGVSEWSARVPVAITASLALAAVWFLGQFLGTRVALFSVLVLASTVLFWLFARAGSTDMPLVGMLTLAMACGFRATLAPSLPWSAATAALLGLAVLAKGPVALILFGGVFLLYFVLINRMPLPLAHLGLGVLIFLVTVVPWFWLVWLENGYAFIATFWINHHVARFVTHVHHHEQPFWYFLVILFFGFFPWTFFLVSAVQRAWRSWRAWIGEEQNLDIFLWLWVLVPLVFFSASQSKLAGYILPAVPPLALLVALEWDRYIQGDVIGRRLLGRQLKMITAVGLLLAVGLGVGFSLRYDSLATGLILALPLLLASLWIQYELRRRRLVTVLLTLVVCMTLFAALTAWRAAPVIERYHSARTLSRVALNSISEEEPLVQYRYFHHTALYYTDYRATKEAVPNREALLEYIEANPQPRYVLLTQRAGWQDLRELPNAWLMRHVGNLYLVEIVPEEDSHSDALRRHETSRSSCLLRALRESAL
jgi:4-amino-4-deoxy-L-arabinose transferase-like glycosyltransferase